MTHQGRKRGPATMTPGNEPPSSVSDVLRSSVTPRTPPGDESERPPRPQRDAAGRRDQNLGFLPGFLVAPVAAAEAVSKMPTNVGILPALRPWRRLKKSHNCAAFRPPASRPCGAAAYWPIDNYAGTCGKVERGHDARAPATAAAAVSSAAGSIALANASRSRRPRPGKLVLQRVITSAHGRFSAKQPARPRVREQQGKQTDFVFGGNRRTNWQKSRNRT